MSKQRKLRIAIVGASGYSGEELIRLLLRHPEAELVCVTSRQYAGEPVGRAFPRFADLNLRFTPPSIASLATADLAFLALPHGLAAEFAVPLFEKGIRIVDISADFRLRDIAVYREYYKLDHPAPQLLESAVYGLPELNRQALQSARLVACPGCYPTSILIPTLPLLRAGIVSTEQIAVCSMSGVSGAGRKVELPYIFPECSESIRPYAVTNHRHLPEIEQEMAAAAGIPGMTINFIPHLVPVNRGIHSTILLTPRKGIAAEQVLEVWRQAYTDQPFVRILAAGQLADTKHVTWSNMIEIACACEPRNGRIIVSSAIDNLTKGAAGQAVQCMNIMCGLEDKLGLL